MVVFPCCAGLALLLSATACNPFSSSSTTAIRSAGTGAAEAHLATTARVIDRLAQRIKDARLSHVNVLLVSSGGQLCAYGAGFLRGWQEHPKPAMPVFDLVTGVGAGTLLTPYALLGTQAALVRGANLFHSPAVQHAPAANLWFERRRAAGLPDNSEYHELVTGAIDERLQADLQPEFRALRQIVFATTDFDLGTQRLWDFGHELGVDRLGRERARALLAASATVPGVYPPILIDRHVHAAGDVFGGLYNPLTLEDYRTLATRLRALGVDDTVQINLWVILNGFLRGQAEEVEPDDRSAMSTRSNTLMFFADQARSVDRAVFLVDTINSAARGLTMELRLTTIPAELAEHPGAFEAYDENFAMHLEQVGYDRGRSNAQWDVTVRPRTRDDD